MAKRQLTPDLTCEDADIPAFTLYQDPQVIESTPPRLIGCLAKESNDRKAVLEAKRQHGDDNWARRQAMEGWLVPPLESSPAAVVKFNDIVMSRMEIMPTSNIVKQMEGRFMGLRIKQLMKVRLMTLDDIHQTVRKEWRSIDDVIQGGHMVLALWRMMVVLGYDKEDEIVDLC